MTATTGESGVPLCAYDLAIDGPAFRAQRQRLLEIVDALHRGRRVEPCPADAELLEGLISLTDEIADQAADRHGIDCLIRATTTMRNPASLTRDELAEIVSGVVRILYGEQQPDGTWTYAPDKPWCGGDVCQEVSELLDCFGLVPNSDDEQQAMERADR